MKREIIVTKDGSMSLYMPELDETYHSVHGALQEARHVFIDNGLKLMDREAISVFEVGFGTGLNTLLSLQFALNTQTHLTYHTVEAYPVDVDLIEKLNYENITECNAGSYGLIHNCDWEKEIAIDPRFKLTKFHSKLEELILKDSNYDLVFFDAFGPRAQCEMWSLENMEKMRNCLVPNGKLVTYCAQGQFKRNLKQVGFLVENVPGPPGKREMTIATKL